MQKQYGLLLCLLLAAAGGAAAERFYSMHMFCGNAAFRAVTPAVCSDADNSCTMFGR